MGTGILLCARNTHVEFHMRWGDRLLGYYMTQESPADVNESLGELALGPEPVPKSNYQTQV